MPRPFEEEQPHAPFSRLAGLARAHALSGIALLALALTTPAPSAADFVDGFEGPTLNPFWTPYTRSGSITFSDSTWAHTGSHSVQFSSTDTGVDKSVRLDHTFAIPVYGSFSIWIYDTGADLASSNYLNFSVSLEGTRKYASIGTADYDQGPGRAGSTYGLNPFDDRVRIETGVDRTQGWHQFLIDTTPAGATFRIDGTTVYSTLGSPIDHIQLSMSGPSWRPAWTSYWDDFQFTEAVPEPASLGLSLIGLGCLGAVVAGRAWRRARSI